MDENNWAIQKAKQIKERRDKEALSKQTKANENEEIRARTDGLWQEVQAAVEKRIQLLRNQLGEPEILHTTRETNELVINVGPMRRVHLEFNPQTFQLDCHLVNTGTRYAAKDTQSVVMFFEDDGRGSPKNPDEITEHILNHIVEFMH